MGFFTRAAMDALMKTTHPEINRRQCWNLHPHRKSCTACKDICPYGDQIFTRPNLVKDWDPCTDCGLCVSVCRSRCISPSPEQVERDTSAADTDNDTIWIGCEKSARKNSMVRACIASLSWEALAYLALNKKIVLDLTPCGECENDTCADQLRAERTRQLKAAMPDNPLHYGCYLPSFTDKCFACGKCEKACRAGALKQEDLPDGQTRMVVTPWKCSECGVCVAACSNKGLDGMKLRQLTTLGPVSLHKCTKTLCKNCGKPIAPDSAGGLCSVCRIKERTKQRQEEARARAQKLKEEREAKKAVEEAAKAAEQAAAPAAEPAVEAAAPAAPQSVAAMLTDEAAAAAGAETAAAVPKTD